MFLGNITKFEFALNVGKTVHSFFTFNIFIIDILEMSWELVLHHQCLTSFSVEALQQFTF